jgi:cell shape-determining protein MreC
MQSTIILGFILIFLLIGLLAYIFGKKYSEIEHQIDKLAYMYKNFDEHFKITDKTIVEDRRKIERLKHRNEELYEENKKLRLPKH